jgi:hypothetical protein
LVFLIRNSFSVQMVLIPFLETFLGSCSINLLCHVFFLFSSGFASAPRTSPCRARIVLHAAWISHDERHHVSLITLFRLFCFVSFPRHSLYFYSRFCRSNHWCPMLCPLCPSFTLSQLQYLYPGIPKMAAFGKYATNEKACPSVLGKHDTGSSREYPNELFLRFVFSSKSF